MQRWSALLKEEISAWPQVSSRPMFGMLAFYRGKKIFAALPHTRAPGTPSSLLIKLPKVRDERLTAGRGPGAQWAAFAMASEADISEALRWLGRAYERAHGKKR
jgi:hypothetical protein